MKHQIVIISVGIIGFLLSGCSSQEGQMTEAEARAKIGAELRKLCDETGLASHFTASNSSEVETWIFIGTNTPYKAETIQEKSTPIWIEDITKQD